MGLRPQPGPFHVLSLCSGYGGIELGLSLAMREARPVAYVEREAHACAVLAARMGEGCLAPAPVWSDLATFDGLPFRGLVDLVTAGIPCQPHSQAGKRLHDADERWLWPEVLRVLDECEAPLLLVENVDGFKKMLPVLNRDLRDRGRRAVAARFSAKEVGAPHRRVRWFILAHDDGPGLRLLRELGLRNGWAQRGDDADGCGARVADDLDVSRRVQPRGRRRKSRPSTRSPPNGRRRPMADAALERRGEGERHLTEEERDHTPDARRRLEHAAPARRPRAERPSGELSRLGPPLPDPLDLFPPGRDRDLWQDVPEDLQPPIPRLVDGTPALVDDDESSLRLRLSGSGVVPLVAALAFRTLATLAVERHGKVDE